jgi:DNA-binding MarR family transcriptional regulator
MRSPQGMVMTELILEIFRVNGQLLEAGDRLTAPLGLTSARWQILGAIEREDRPITVAQIGRRMGLSRQAVQRVVNDLEKSGFVTLETNPDHQRAKLVVPTPSCLETLIELDDIQSQWVNELAGCLSQSTLNQVKNSIIKIRQQCDAIESETNPNQEKKHGKIQRA